MSGHRFCGQARMEQDTQMPTTRGNRSANGTKPDTWAPVADAKQVCLFGFGCDRHMIAVSLEELLERRADETRSS